jgi:hypothetical protein
MADAQSVQQLISEVGPLDDAILEVVQTGDDSFALRYEHVDVELEIDAEGGRLMLSTEIGEPPLAQRLSIYQSLLTYSLLWRETGGVHMALAGPQGAVIQMTDLTFTELTPTLLATVAANLASRTLTWRAFFASDTAGTTDVRVDPLAELGMGIRV